MVYRWKYVADKVRRSGGCSEDNRAVTGEADRLLDDKPIEYVAMALSGEMQAYCDIEDENRSKECFG